MTDQNPNEANHPLPPPYCEFDQEIRFAVVMYGGISLAIYMNGVAQELFQLVRATAPQSLDSDKSVPAKLSSDELKGTASVYRKLGQMLRQNQQQPKPLSEIKPYSKIYTRFVVDVISGTSAGGINGVFLAKALANDQEMNKLKELWIKEGDFDHLLNKDSGRKARGKPKSLLDGKHMYRALLKALVGMEAKGNNVETACESPYVEELDLFVTATDISGLKLPIRLADMVVKERRHRNVFHFIYTIERASGINRNDFQAKNNPFLAFAARCTSSFPFAFEPMKLGDIDALVQEIEPYKGMKRDELKKYLSGNKKWRKFFEDYLRNERAESDFPKRAFADGGNLDNKPFSYATDTLLRRSADLPVDRKLIYIDPDPENPDEQPDFDGDIDVLKNTLAALSPTVSTETIREDLQRVLERNQLLERLKHITNGIEGDVRLWQNDQHKTPLPGNVWADQDMEEMIKSKGIGYGGYHRLKVAVLTDELAMMIVRAANFELDSAQFQGVRHLVTKWRDEKYVRSKSDLKDGQPVKPTQNQFIMDFDLNYRIRRLNFLRARINEFSGLDSAELWKKLKSRDYLFPSAMMLTNEFRQPFQEELRKIQVSLGKAQKELLILQRKYQRRLAKNELFDLVKATEINEATLEELMKKSTEEERDKYSTEIFQRKIKTGDHAGKTVREMFELIAAHIAASFKAVTKEASKICMDELAVSTPALTFHESLEELDEAVEKYRRYLRSEKLLDRALVHLNNSELAVRSAPSIARAILRYYYDFYEDFDMVSFPITYQTGVGETSKVDIIRISPYDAKNLIDEAEEEKKNSNGRKGKVGRHKLGGTALGHFGAFLKKGWRWNDIMWGRLDAAERIITALLPNNPDDVQLMKDRQALIDEVHKIIIEEELLPKGYDNVRNYFVEALANASAECADEPMAGSNGQVVPRKYRTQTIKSISQKLKEGQRHNSDVSTILDSCVNKQELLDFFKSEYEVNRQLDPQATVNLMAQSTRIVGKMLEELAKSRRVENKQVAWVARLGQLFWAFAQVAMPGGLWNLFFYHVVHVLYVIEGLIILGGTLLISPTAQQFGLKALALTVATHVAVILLGDYMIGRFKWWRAILFSLYVLVPVSLAISGLDPIIKWLNLSRFETFRNISESTPVRDFYQGYSTEKRALIAFCVASFIALLVTRVIPGGLRGIYGKIVLAFEKVKSLALGSNP